jgi:hypothetical protein
VFGNVAVIWLARWGIQAPHSTLSCIKQSSDTVASAQKRAWKTDVNTPARCLFVMRGGRLRARQFFSGHLAVLFAMQHASVPLVGSICSENLIRRAVDKLDT